MKTLLLCGYRDQSPPTGDVIDRRISELHAVGAECVCVLSGESAEEHLRTSAQIATVEMAYDDSPQKTLLGNLRAGLAYIGEGPCFILPVEIPAPPKPMWDLLKETSVETTLPHILQAVGQNGVTLDFGFPLVLTAEGSRLLSRTPDMNGLIDRRFDYLSVVASPPKPL